MTMIYFQERTVTVGSIVSLLDVWLRFVGREFESRRAHQNFDQKQPDVAVFLCVKNF